MRGRLLSFKWRCPIASSLIRLLALAILMAGSANAQSGGGYTIKKNTIDSGGGTVTGGAYRLSATVGQHDAGDPTGGQYKLTGGFWSPTAAIPCPIPDPDPSAQKTRFISFTPVICPSSPGGESALRVRLVSLHHVNPPYAGGATVPFTSFEGQVRWVGPPGTYYECSSFCDNPFHASMLQCTPYYQDWSTVGLLHVRGSAIVPSSIYEVENVAASCQGNEASCTAVSAPLTVATTRWGDVETPYNPPSTTTQPDLGDVAALVSKFKSAPGSPIKARALLTGDDAFGIISPLTLSLDLGFGHIAACVDAFKGKPYPHTIQACP